MMNSLDKERAERLAAEYISNRNAGVRDEVIQICLPIARSVARKFSGRGVDGDDLFQVASLAMVKALERFEPEKNVKFTSFIVPCMVGEVRNYFRDCAQIIRLPRRGVQLAVQVERAKNAFEQENGRSPRPDEIAQRLQIPLENVLEALEIYAHRTLSLDDESADAPIADFLGEQDPALEAFETREQLQSAMLSLDERQRAIIRLRYFENLSQRQVAERLNLSQMTVSRAERSALDALKKNIN